MRFENFASDALRLPPQAFPRVSRRTALANPLRFLALAALLLRMSFLGAPNVAAAEIVISEFMALNEGTLLDEDGAPTDWKIGRAHV